MNPHAAEVAALRAALEKVRIFLDFYVREQMPNDHVNCGIDSGCAHAAMETEIFDELDRHIDAITAVLQPGDGGKGGA
jgi:hypothetical protein